MFGCNPKENSQGENFLSKVDSNQEGQPVGSSQLAFFRNPRNTIPAEMELLPFGSIEPRGWILDMMREDINSGIVGNLDQLAPDVLREDDMYNTERRKSVDDIPAIENMTLTGEAWEQSIQWWNSESLGNWIDGYVRNALLADDKEAVEKSKSFVEYILTTQDEDGYIGIYGPELRYRHKGSNGELWSQTTLFRMLLGYYESTGDERVLQAVERAMSLTMKEYGPDGRSPFDVGNSFGGVTHGVMITDVCETLHRITGKQEYQDYAVYIYQEFSRYPLNRAFNDVRYEYLLKDFPFQSHSVHTYEHLRTLIYAYFATGYPELEKAFDKAEMKLESCILPSGGGFGDEWIEGRNADPDETAAEFCSQFELREYFGSALQKTGMVKYADQYEKITFNAILGKRNEDGTAITYCKTDNSYGLAGTSPRHGKDQRFKYSPVHSDVAICCAPNYGKHLPYYVGNMWMSKNDGLAAVHYGPAQLKTKVNEADVEVLSKTNYPFSDEIILEIRNSQLLEYALYLRKPQWVESIAIDVENAQVSLEKGFYRIFKEWSSNEVVKLSFDQKVKVNNFNEEVYFQRGPLVYALPIPHERKVIRKYEHKDFSDYYCYPVSSEYENLQLEDLNFSSVFHNVNGRDPWNSKDTYFSGTFFDTQNGESKKLKLYPMGSTVLRRVTFPLKKPQID